MHLPFSVIQTRTHARTFWGCAGHMVCIWAWPFPRLEVREMGHQTDVSNTWQQGPELVDECVSIRLGRHLPQTRWCGSHELVNEDMRTQIFINSTHPYLFQIFYFLVSFCIFDIKTRYKNIQENKRYDKGMGALNL